MKLVRAAFESAAMIGFVGLLSAGSYAAYQVVKMYDIHPGLIFVGVMWVIGTGVLYITDDKV